MRVVTLPLPLEHPFKWAFYTLIYVKEQSPAFQRAYIEAFIQDCTTAYEGTDGMTCVMGR
jgi:hypothetical protein